MVTSIKIDRDFWKKIKMEAVRRNMSIADIVSEALEMWLARSGGEDTRCQHT